MIDIRLDGESVDMAPNTSLTLERWNPLLEFEKVPGSRVYGFDLPNTPRNRALLGYFYEPQVGYTSRKFRCEKYVYGQLQEQGYVMIQDVKPSGFSLYFTQNLGEIFGDRQNQPLASMLELGQEPVPVAPVAAANHLTDRYCFPTIENPAFYGNAAVAGWGGLMNEYSGVAYNGYARVPMLFLRWVYQQFGNLTGWSFTGGFWQDPDLARLILYNTYSLDAPSALVYANHLPALTLPQLTMDLRKLFNLYLEFDVRRNICTMDFGADVLAGSEILDWTEKAHPEHVKAPELVNRLELSYALDSNDAQLKPVPAAMDKYTTLETAANEGGSVLPIQARVSTLATNAVSGRAVTSQAGQSPLNKEGKNDSTAKLLFWNGLVGGEPRATAAHGARSLYWHGANSLAGAYSGFESFKANTFSITKLVYLTSADLALFSFRKKVHIKGVTYLVGSMKAVLGSTGPTIPTEVQLWRV
ncbi:hypothetical protein [Rudanella lutea]|uniref:hypothetical protein n=1 Tax=Rudanella lutea TaxID=451374 RepID=UPI00036000E8|nr:hypothetical protein [Rudanella lutea]